LNVYIILYFIIIIFYFFLIIGNQAKTECLF